MYPSTEREKRKLEKQANFINSKEFEDLWRGMAEVRRLTDMLQFVAMQYPKIFQEAEDYWKDTSMLRAEMKQEDWKNV